MTGERAEERKRGREWGGRTRQNETKKEGAKRERERMLPYGMFVSLHLRRIGSRGMQQCSVQRGYRSYVSSCDFTLLLSKCILNFNS